MNAWMYMLKCSDGSLYVGSTIELELRIAQHQNGLGANYTRKRLPIELIYSEQFLSIEMAFQREQQIKNWSRAKKIALANGEIKELIDFSKSKSV